MSASTTIQREFDLKLPAGQPLVRLTTVMDLLNCNEDAVLNLIELRLVKWAFNIGQKNAKRREVRIWRESMLEYLRNAECGTRSAEWVDNDRRPFEVQLNEVVSRILPKITPGGHSVTRPTIRGREISRRLACSPQHVLDLMREGALTESSIEVGPKISPFILHASCVDFLKTRVIK